MTTPAADAAARPVLIGHRGAALLEPENTLRSFRRALADGADGVECDVHLSADGHIVVMHDESVDRTADPASPRRTGALAALTRAALDEVVLGEGEHVPSLQQLLDLLDDTGRTAEGAVPQAYVEVKAPAAAEAVGALLAGREGATVISFIPDALAAIRRSAPHVPIGWIVQRTDESVFATLAELGAEWVSIDVDAVTRADVDRAHAAGVQVNVWTANTDEQLDRALEAGADSISTDDAGWALARLRRA